MANVSGKGGVPFVDLNKWKSMECRRIMDHTICEIKFSGGRLVLTKNEIEKICKSKKWRQ